MHIIRVVASGPKLTVCATVSNSPVNRLQPAAPATVLSAANSMVSSVSSRTLTTASRPLLYPRTSHDVPASSIWGIATKIIVAAPPSTVSSSLSSP